MKRRTFVKNSVNTGIGLGLLGNSIRLNGMEPPIEMFQPKICIFSKHLQWLDYRNMAEMAKKLGFDGVDLTVRPGGHVLPENVERDLPLAFEEVKKAGLKMPMITTRILDAKDPVTHNILKTASALGIKTYRTGWWKYNGKPVKTVLQEKNKMAIALAELNQKYGIQGAYQNHAGNYVGAPCWDLLELLKDVDPKWMGVQFDIRHAHVEGAFSWPYSMEVLAPYINTIDIKDYVWEKNNGEWKLRNVPLGEGMVDFKAFFKRVDNLKVKADISIHFEYPLGGADHGKRELTISEAEFTSIVEKDINYLKMALGDS